VRQGGTNISVVDDANAKEERSSKKLSMTKKSVLVTCEQERESPFLSLGRGKKRLSMMWCKKAQLGRRGDSREEDQEGDSSQKGKEI